jgi:hypothetical protein
MHSSEKEIRTQLTNTLEIGVPNFFQGFPTKDKVQSELGLSNDQLAALPTQVLNIPPYANWSGGKWNVRFHGNVRRIGAPVYFFTDMVEI